MSESRETELGILPLNWDVVSVNYLVEQKIIEKPLDGNHGEIHPKGTDFVNLGIPFIMATDVINGKVDLVNCKFITEEQAKSLNKGFSITGDVLLTHKASLGRTAIVGKIKTPYIVLTPQVTYYRVKNKHKLNNKYLKYYFDSPIFQDTLINHGDSGSTRAYVGITAQRELPIILPSISEQKAIAGVLSSLDDKIDLLHRQNKTLEQMAEALFRQWFIEEAGEDWKFVELGNYVNCFNGVSYKSSDLNPSKTAMVTLKSFDRNGGFRLDGFKEFTGKYKEQHIVKQGDLVVAHTDITQDAEVIGNPALVVENNNYVELIISMDLVKVISKYEWLSNEFLYLMMRTREFKQHCLGYSNGSTVLHLNKEAVPSFEFFLPPKEKIQKYTEQAKNVLDKKFKNIAQIQTLEKLRDNLLPKLMSGEVRVKY